MIWNDDTELPWVTIISQIWRFPKVGVPQIIHSSGMFNIFQLLHSSGMFNIFQLPSSYWGTPIPGNPHMIR